MHFWTPAINSPNMASMEKNGTHTEDLEHCLAFVDSFKTGSTILDHLPPILQRGYFRPRRGKPQTTTSRSAKKKQPTTTEHIIHIEKDIE